MSLSRHCSIYKASDNNWYMELAEEEYGESDDATCYGPFDSEEAACGYVDNFSNPGGWDVDSSGRTPPPKKSPNGDPVERPRSRSSSRW